MKIVHYDIRLKLNYVLRFIAVFYYLCSMLLSLKVDIIMLI